MSEKFGGIENRRHPRISWNFQVKFRLRGVKDAKWLLSNIINISEGGCFFYSPIGFEVGQILEIEILIPRLLKPMHFIGQVRRKEGDENAMTLRFGIAIMFLEIEADKKKDLIESINFFLKKKG